MTLVVEENYAFGIPQTAVPGFAPAGAEWHWSAGGPGRAGWEGTVVHLINTRWEINASYHGGLWAEHGPGHVGCRTILQWIVRTTVAAHSNAPSQAFAYHPTKDRAVQDARFAEVRRILGAKAADPNAGVLAIAYAGMPADLERDLGCASFRADVQNLARQLVAHPAVVDRPHFGHGWIQPISRYEMDVPVLDFIGLLYAATPDLPAPTPEEDDVPIILRPVREKWNTKASADGSAGYFTTDGPGLGERKWFTEAEIVESYGETADGRYRAVWYAGTETIWMERGQIDPVPGSRQPATGYGITTDDFDLDLARRLAEKDAALDRILTLEGRLPTLEAATKQMRASVQHTRDI